MTFLRWRNRFVFIAAVLCAGTVSASDCERRIAASGPSARTVVLAGGDSWTLFKRFLSEIEQRDLDVSLWKTEVQISRGGQTETFNLGWAMALTGESAEKLWERRLAGKRAELNRQLLAEARSARWDVVCVGQLPSPPARPSITRPPTPPTAPRTSEALVFFKNGVQYAARHDYANALKEFKAVERLSPKFEGLAMNIGVAYLQLKDYVRASEYLGRAVAQSPNDSAAHYNMACLQARLGQQEDAIASLTAARAHGMKMTAEIRRDSDLASLHGRPDFELLFK